MSASARILVAEDQLDIAETLGQALEMQGYEVKKVTDGVGAINALLDESFDVALLDVKMPNVSGFGVLKFVQKYNPKTKVVVITSYGDQQHIAEAKALGASAFIVKPYDIADLLGTVNRLLQTPAA